jgi:adenylate cyclase
MEIDRAVILLVNQESGELEQKAFKVREGLSSLHPFYSAKITNLAYQTGDAFLSEDSSRDERLTGSLSVISESIQTSICVPLKTFTDTIGVLYVDNLSLLKVYSQEDLEFLIALANQAAAHVYLAREWEKRKQTLKQLLLEIEIQIDQSKKEKEIEEIVNSDFFRSLEQRVEKLREDLA